MPYQIQYDQSGMQMDIQTEIRRTEHTGWKILVGILILLLIYVWNTNNLQEYLIPGDNEITKRAFAELDQTLRDGEPFQAAFYDFCRDIVQKDDIS